MYKRVESGGYKVLLFISLLVILISLVLVSRDGMKNYLLSGFYENSFQREIPLMDVKSAYNEGKSATSSTLFKIIGSGLNRELNLLGIDYVQANGVNNKSIATSACADQKGNEGINEFIFDYGAYENRNIKVNRRYSENENKKNLVAGVYNPALIFDYPQDKPQVLIYHTHTGEGYGSDNSDERDNEKNVVAVGKALSEELENYGINVIHDKTVHDNIDYNKAYEYSGITLQKYLDKYGDMDLVIDLHRDDVKNKSSVTTEINGKDVARIMFVLERGNQNFKDNYKVESDLLNITNILFPGLLREKQEIIYNSAKGHLNQHKSKAVVVIEAGAHTNKPQEAKETAKYLGRIMAEYLYKKYTEV
ncbi:stage II sporulation protein P [Oceanirhabdus seepicola]|uniref:Stage II sporulation protein P n=1 Tax=Oceanirhabdus seepicola TaxID=2828781 RepID=A0A9J6P5H0_9CLOT|nr:stage II sporulation protein P [Oceanirhabdus seepicola]MCM1990776.1 stage II sporulation protein P [Oceanirhabdus seepicola]